MENTEKSTEQTVEEKEETAEQSTAEKEETEETTEETEEQFATEKEENEEQSTVGKEENEETTKETEEANPDFTGDYGELAAEVRQLNDNLQMFYEIQVVQTFGILFIAGVLLAHIFWNRMRV